MVENREYEVSVVVLTYKSSFEKIKNTLDSIMEQEDVFLQIIVSDDGSPNNHKDEIIYYFEEHQFIDYVLVMNLENKGTVLNYLEGLQRAQGKYIKAISPGDKLFGKTILRNWIDYMKASNSTWSFADAVYYIKENGLDVAISVLAHPQGVDVYKGNSNISCRWQYLVLDDIALGAAILGEKEAQLTYCRRIANKVIYAEDNIWRMMMFDGIIGSYYEKNAILYEYGSGISTNGNSVWKERINKDWNTTNEIMFEDYSKMDQFQRKICKAVAKNNRLSKWLVRGKVMHKLKLHFYPRMTSDII